MQRASPPGDFDVEQWNDQLARDYDIDEYHGHSSQLIRFVEQRRLDAIRQLVAPRAGEQLLEVGCGGGHVLRLFPECERTGVDVSGKMLEKARKNLAGHRVTLLKGEVGKLELAPSSFDTIVCTEVLEHTVDPEGLLGDMARLLRPTGRAVITLPNDHLVNGAKRWLARARLTWLPPLRRMSWGADHYHLHVWRIAEMRQLLARHFQLVRETLVPSRLLPIRCCFLCRPHGR